MCGGFQGKEKHSQEDKPYFAVKENWMRRGLKQKITVGDSPNLSNSDGHKGEKLAMMDVT